MDAQEFKSQLVQLGEPIDMPAISRPETLLARFCPHSQGTNLSEWVSRKGTLANDPDFYLDGIRSEKFGPVVVFPEQEKPAFRISIPDTVVINVPTKVYTVTGPDGYSQSKPVDPELLSRTVANLFGVPGTYAKVIDNGSDGFYQQYYLATCNIPLPIVHKICTDIENGEYKVDGLPIQFVRLDICSNFPAAVRPQEFGDEYLLSLGWDYKNNREYVGDCVHTYVIETYADKNGEEQPFAEAKIYDKLRDMLEQCRVADKLGDKYPDILDSRHKGVHISFRDKRVQAQGLSRVESRLYGMYDLNEMVRDHLQRSQLLVSQHGEICSLQECYENFLQPNHAERLVIVENLHYGTIDWVFGRSVNRLTDKVNGWAGKDLDDAMHTLQYRTMGIYPVEIYWFTYKCGIARLTHRATLLPDPLHRGNVTRIAANGETQAKANKHTWEEVGLDIPLSTATYNGKARNLTFRSKSPEEYSDMANTSIKQLQKADEAERKAVKAEQQREKRMAKKLEELKEQVIKDAQEHPTTWKQILHISELASVAKPYCTACYWEADSKYPAYVLKVGKKWYKGNSAVTKILNGPNPPQLPFVVQVWDSGSSYKNSKVWDVEIKDISDFA